MKTRKPSRIKVNLITLGCSKNLVDSEVLLRQLDYAKFEVSHNSSSKRHDIVIINTCGFINDARQESIETILDVIKAKRQKQVTKVIVMGCLSARYYEDLKKEIPEVDAYFGVNKFHEIIEYLGREYKNELIGERLLTTPSHYAYLKISEGCNRKCSFCVIPLIRGKHISRPVEEILKEALLLAEKGVKELILIAQDLTYYGIDLYQKRKLAFLLEKLSEIEGIKWIRLQYAYPALFPMDVLKVMNERGNICKYLDIPFQHINDRLLKSMERGISKDKTLKLIETIRKKVPYISLRTSMIVGYPGETEKEFQELLNFVRQVKFDRLGVFTYSHEENTKAFGLKDKLSSKIKQQRADKLMQVQQEISYERNVSLIGTKLNIIIDRKEGDYYIGRTEFDSPEVDNEILITAAKHKLRVGNFYTAKVTDAEPFDLFGEIIC
ncbi:MAG: 30S ribosomal protein S12 methylthiotransferase RimO [Bacteroidales bacterium]